MGLKMRYVAAYLLAALGGNESPSTSDLKTILESVGVGFDDERAEIVVNQCKGKSIPELIAAGSEKWPLCQPVVVQQLRPQLVVMPQQQQSKRRKKRRKNHLTKDQMMTWVSDFSINSIDACDVVENKK